MKKVAFLLLLAISFSSCSSVKQADDLNVEKSVKTFTLKKEAFSKVLELSGTLEAARETPIAAKVGGRVMQINYDVGDLVATGDLVASLAGDESAVNFQTTTANEANVISAQSSQKILLDEQVANAEKALEIAKANLAALKIAQSDTSVTTNEQIIFTEKSVDQAKTALDNAKTAADQRLKSLYGSASSAVLSTLIITESANGFADNILGVSDEKENMNQHIKKYLAAFDAISKIDATNSLRLSLTAWDDLKQVYDEKIKDQNPSYEEMDEYLAQSLDLLETAKVMLSDLYSVLDATTTGADFTEQELNALKMENITIAQNIEKTILSTSGNFRIGVKGIILNIDDTITQNQLEISTAEKALLKAEQALSQAKAGASQNVSSVNSQKVIAEKQVEQVEAALNSAKAQRESVLKNLKTQLDLVRGNKQLSGVALSNTQIYAPFDGVITSKNVEVGQVVAPGQSILNIADISYYKVKTDIPDTKIKDVEIGSTALVRIDGLNGEYEAQVVKIDPRVDPLTRKLYIELALIEKPKNAKVGMFAKISVDLPEEESFFVPREFIKSSFEGPYVQLKNGEKIYIKKGDKKGDKNGSEIKIWFENIKEGIEIVK